jgi:hypothetical protein
MVSRFDGIFPTLAFIQDRLPVAAGKGAFNIDPGPVKSA